MTRSFPLPTLLATAILAALPAGSALAQQAPQPQDRGRASDSAQRDQRANMTDAIRRAERNTRGETLSAERVQYDGRDMHRVKVVDDSGRVRVFMQEPRRQQDGRSSGSARGNRDGGNRSTEPRRPTRDDDN